MIRDRKILSLSIVLTVLVIVYILGSIFTRTGRQQEIHSVPILTPLERESIHSFELEGGTGSVSLSIGEDGSWWIVTEDVRLPASEDKVDHFLESLLTIRTLRFATDDEELFEDFSVAEPVRYISFRDDEGALIKRLVLSETEAEAGAETGPSYVRVQPAEKIYQVDDDLSFYMRQDGNYWADLDLFPTAVTPESVLRVDVAGDFTLSDGYNFAGAYTLVKRADGDEEWWEIISGDTGTSEADPGETERVITTLAELRGFAFAEDQNRAGKGLEETAASIRFESGGEEYRLIVGSPAKEEGSRYLEVSAAPYLYLVKEWALKRIFKPGEELERNDAE
ncbi:MAG: DUF4340 domain-containing protein [Spirochaetota bacterium]